MESLKETVKNAIYKTILEKVKTIREFNSVIVKISKKQL